MYEQESSRNQILSRKWEKQILAHPIVFLVVEESVHTSYSHKTHYSLSGALFITTFHTKSFASTHEQEKLSSYIVCHFAFFPVKPKRFLWIRKMFVHSTENLSDYEINKGIWYDKKTKIFIFALCWRRSGKKTFEIYCEYDTLSKQQRINII